MSLKNSNTHVHGSIVTGGPIDINAGANFHYDRALADRQAIAGGSTTPRVTYLHVSVNRVNVTSG